MEKLGKNDLVDQVSKRVPRATKSEVTDIISEFIEVVKSNLEDGNEISLKNFMTMKPVRTKERMGRNPNTNQSMVIPPKNDVKLKLSAAFRKSLN